MHTYVHEFPVGDDRSTTNYDALNAHMRLEEDPPEGLILHAAGFTDDTFRMIEIWESPEHAERFQRERLMPALTATGADAAPPPATHSYQLHNLIVRA